MLFLSSFDITFCPTFATDWEGSNGRSFCL